MRNTIVAVLVLALACVVSAESVLVLGDPYVPAWNSDVQAKLLSTGRFSTVDIINSGTTTPTLAQLDAYSAVLAYTDSGTLANSTALGNNLADYVDQGHGLVLAVFANTSLAIGGRLQSGNYDPIVQSSQTQNIDLHLGKVYNSASPLVAGVDTFDGGSSSYHATGGITAGATRVADWSDGTPLVAFKNNVVGLNFFPPSNTVRSDLWKSSTDGANLMADALQFADGTSTSATPLPSTVIAGLSLLGCVGAGQFFRRTRALPA